MTEFVPVNAASGEARTDRVLKEFQRPTVTGEEETIQRVRRSAADKTQQNAPDRDTTAVSYGAITLLAATFALSMWLFPKRVGNFLFGDRVLESQGYETVRESFQHISDAVRYGQHPPQYGVGQATIQLNPLHYTLLRILGTALGAASVAAHALRGATLANKLHLNTYKRLEVGLLLWALTSLSLSRSLWNVLTRPAAMLMSALPILVLSVAGPQLLRSNALQVLGNTMSDLRKPRTLRAGLYALLVPAFAAAGVLYMLAPATSLRLVFGRDGGSACQLLWQLIGSGLHLVPFVNLNLKKAADDHRLGASTHILLNLGLGAAGLGHLLALGHAWRKGLHGPAMPALLGTWLLTTLLSVNSIPAESTGLPAAAAEALVDPSDTMPKARDQVSGSQATPASIAHGQVS
eukprot:jgi/Botrbrau1/13081/Bobra.0187s0042.1